MDSSGTDDAPIEPIFECDDQLPFSTALRPLGDDLVGIGNDSGELLAIYSTAWAALIKQIKSGITSDFAGVIQIDQVSVMWYVVFADFNPERRVEITERELEYLLEAARSGELDKVLEDAAA